MRIRCTLTGHRFDETEAEQERSEDGDKVVIVTKEYDVCIRCGQRSLNNETKEVTSTAAGADTTETESTDTSQSDMTEPTEPEDAGIILEDDGEDTTAEATEEWPEQDDTGDEQPASPTEDWPEHETADQGAADAQPDGEQQGEAPPATESWPDHDGEDEGIPASSPAGEDADVDYVGLTPTSDESTTNVDPDELTFEKETAAPTVEDTGRPTQTMDPVCPARGFADSGGHGSLRRGDICPECLDGYLTVDEEHNK